MHTESMLINDARGLPAEISVLTRDNVIDPGNAYSYPLRSIRNCQANYLRLFAALQKLIKDGILVYDREDNGCQVFTHKLNVLTGHSKEERVDIRFDDSKPTHRCLEDMLYFVYSAHNIPIPQILKPKNALMTLYTRFFYPEKTEDEIKAAMAMLAFGIAFISAFCIDVARGPVPKNTYR